MADNKSISNRKKSLRCLLVEFQLTSETHQKKLVIFNSHFCRSKNCEYVINFSHLSSIGESFNLKIEKILSKWQKMVNGLKIATHLTYQLREWAQSGIKWFREWKMRKKKREIINLLCCDKGIEFWENFWNLEVFYTRLGWFLMFLRAFRCIIRRSLFAGKI